MALPPESAFTDDADVGASTASSVTTPVSQAAAAVTTGEEIAAAQGAERPKMRVWMSTLLLIAYAGTYLAFITPLAFSLAVRVQQLDAEGKDALLPLAIGIPAVVILFTGPLAAVFSDRTRSRLGRRRPFLIAGAVLGLLGTAGAAFAPNVPLLIAAWTIGYIGYALSANMIITHLGDRLPARQRGRISGATGAATQIAPVIGIVLVSSLATMPVAMFLIPGVISFITVLVFVLVMRDEPLTGAVPSVGFRQVLRGFWFNPRRYPDLGWVWLSRAFLFLAIGFTSVYTIYFLGERLALDAAQIAALIATASIGGVATSILGAVVCGFLSDRFKRRKPFLVVSALLMAVSLIVTAGVTASWQYIVAGLILTFAIGAYGAVDQATALDVIPQAEGENARYLAIVILGNQVPQAVGPFVAGVIVAAAAGNYGSVYIGAAVAAVIGAVAILPLRISRAAAANSAAAATASAAS